MSKQAGKTHERRARKKSAAPPPPPIDVANGIPDRSSRPGRRRLVWILLIFAAWVAFLIYCQVAGSP
jgi:hypothetical protein